MPGPTGRERGWDITINGVPYRVVRKDGVPVWDERSLPATQGKDVELFQRERRYDTWHLGGGWNDLRMPGAYSYALGADGRFPRALLPGPRVQTVTDSGDAQIYSFFEQAGGLYFLTNAYCKKVLFATDEDAADTISAPLTDGRGVHFDATSWGDGTGHVPSMGVNFDGATIIGFTSAHKIFAFKELMTNGGLETAGAGGADVFGTWVETAGDGAIAATTTAGEFRTGTAAKLTAGATANTEITNNITVTAGSKYLWTFWTRGDGTNAGRKGIYDVSNSAYIAAVSSTVVTSATYTMVNNYFTAPAGCTSVRLELWCPTANGGIAYFDDCSMAWALSAATYGAYGTKFYSDNASDWVLVGTASGTPQVFTCAQGSDPLASASWSAAVDVGDTSNAITGLAGGERTLWVAKTDGLYYVQLTRTPKVLDVKLIDSTNGANLLLDAAGYVYYACKEAYYRYDPSSGEAVDVSPARGLPNTFVMGPVSAHCTFKGWIYAATWNGTNAYLIVGRARESDEPGIGPIIWHGSIISAIGAKITAMHVTSLPTTAPRLYAGTSTGVIGHFKLPVQGDNPLLDSTATYNVTGQLITSFDNWDVPGTQWQPLSLEFETVGATSTNTLTVALQYDGLTTGYIVGTINTSPRQVIQIPTAITTLAADIASGATSMTVASATGFPATDGWFAQLDSETVKVTAGSGTTTWTITRAQRGSSAAAHTAGALVSGNDRFANMRLVLTYGLASMSTPITIKGITLYAVQRPALYTLITTQVYTSDRVSSNFDIAHRVSGKTQLANLRALQTQTFVQLNDWWTGSKRTQTVLIGPPKATMVKQDEFDSAEMAVDLQIGGIA